MAEMSTGYTWPLGLTYIVNLWHSGILVLSAECQSAWMSKIENFEPSRPANGPEF